jgi:hypothetical protein
MIHPECLGEIVDETQMVLGFHRKLARFFFTILSAGHPLAILS